MERTTQQERLKGIVRDYIAPTMKKLGFRKKARWFNRENQETGYRESMNVLSNRFNTKNDVGFALDLWVYDGDKIIGDSRVESRETGKYAWYELTPKVNANQLGQEIREDILAYVPAYFKGGK